MGSLDVDCGHIVIGDENVDLFILKPNPHIDDAIIRPRKIQNLIFAEVRHFLYLGVPKSAGRRLKISHLNEMPKED
jgi:hypothetical protein